MLAVTGELWRGGGREWGRVGEDMTTFAFFGSDIERIGWTHVAGASEEFTEFRAPLALIVFSENPKEITFLEKLAIWKEKYLYHVELYF